jgi:hypothetical protein
MVGIAFVAAGCNGPVTSNENTVRAGNRTPSQYSSDPARDPIATTSSVNQSRVGQNLPSGWATYTNHEDHYLISYPAASDVLIGHTNDTPGFTTIRWQNWSDSVMIDIIAITGLTENNGVTPEQCDCNLNWRALIAAPEETAVRPSDPSGLSNPSTSEHCYEQMDTRRISCVLLAGPARRSRAVGGHSICHPKCCCKQSREARWAKPKAELTPEKIKAYNTKQGAGRPRSDAPRCSPWCDKHTLAKAHKLRLRCRDVTMPTLS